MVIKKCLRVIKSRGALPLAVKVKNRLKYKLKAKAYIKNNVVSEEELEKQASVIYKAPLLISVAVPLFNTPEEYLRQLLDSLIDQTYKNWELCLADAGERDLSPVIRSYEDSRIRYKRLDKNYGISENTNMAVAMAKGRYIALLDHDDLIAPNCLFEYRKAIDKGADMLYCDEASFVRDIASPEIIHFKPAFSPFNLRGNNYICHFLMCTKALYEAVGGLRESLDGSQDHDLALRLSERAKKITHINKVLYFWRMHGGSVATDISAKPYCINSGVRAVSLQLFRQNTEGSVRSIDGETPVYRCDYRLNTRVRCRRISDFSNKAVADFKGDYIALVPKGLKVERAQLHRLMTLAAQPGVAVAGGIGVSCGLVRAGVLRAFEGDIENPFKNQLVKGGGYMHRLEYVQNVNMLSLFGVISKKFLEDIGGFNEGLPQEERLADLCIKLRSRGMQILLDPQVAVEFKGGEITPGKAFKRIHRSFLEKEDEYFTENYMDYVQG